MVLPHCKGMKQIVDVFHVLGVTKNMLYVGAIVDMGHVVMFNATKCWVMTFQEPRKVVVVGTRDCDSGFTNWRLLSRETCSWQKE